MGTRRAVRGVVQGALGAGLLFAGTTHLTIAREEFRAQVPRWVPLGEDTTVLASGVVELALGGALVLTWRQPARAVVGATAAAFFVAIFPGNLSQLRHHVDAFGLDTDTKRAVRLVFQPLLVAAALVGTDAVGTWRRRRARERG